MLEVVEMVASISDKPYRPALPMEGEPMEEGMLDLMVQCWQEQHGDRPDFSAIQQKLKDINNDQ